MLIFLLLRNNNLWAFKRIEIYNTNAQIGLHTKIFIYTNVHHTSYYRHTLRHTHPYIGSHTYTSTIYTHIHTHIYTRDSVFSVLTHKHTEELRHTHTQTNMETLGSDLFSLLSFASDMSPSCPYKSPFHSVFVVI